MMFDALFPLQRPPGFAWESRGGQTCVGQPSRFAAWGEFQLYIHACITRLSLMFV